uniref:DUF7153 domain-containing protein n=1 Tax=Plectus sambesii TaxID=2011161 RepID=A0A914WRK7_9BILA
MLALRPQTSIAAATDLGSKEHFGAFEEVYSIIKTTSTFETRLPAHRHTGYIVIGFKLLEDQNDKNLEQSWLQWTGAREIYKHAPRNWNLRRITFHRCHRPPRSGRSTPSTSASVPGDSFAYVLMCEFGNILHPANTVQAFDVCERLRVRNCGHVALYQVQWTYGRIVPAAGRPALLSAEGGMSRGFSHDLETTETSPRRRHSPLRHRDRSLGYSGIEESMRYDSYHHLHRDDY